MRLLRNLVLITLPILVMINIYRYVFATADNIEFEFRGINYLAERFSTFPGFNITENIFTTIQEKATSFNNIDIQNLGDVFTAVGNIVQLIGLAFSIPVIIVIDLVRDVWWFIETMFVK